MGTQSHRVKGPGYEASHSLLSSAVVKNDWVCNSNPALRFHRVCRENIFFPILRKLGLLMDSATNIIILLTRVLCLIHTYVLLLKTCVIETVVLCSGTVLYRRGGQCMWRRPSFRNVVYTKYTSENGQ